MRHLGIDYGRKRIGIAISDPEGKIAFPRRVLTRHSTVQAIREIAELMKCEKIEQVVIGLPASLDGRETKMTEEVRAFARVLQKQIKCAVAFENEMLTTKIARQAGVKKEHRDASSAALILQSYLDRIR